MKILLVESDQKTSRSIRNCLEEQAHTVIWARSCLEARDCIYENSSDLVILGLELPDGDGIDLLQEWRKNQVNELILALSCRNTVMDCVRGLNCGADDYLCKPFNYEELLARVRALLRRNQSDKGVLLQHRELSLNLVSRICELNGNPVDLTRREFALMELFLQNRGRVLTRTWITEKIWEQSRSMDTNLIDVYIRKLRRKLGTNAKEEWIKTIRGTGYLLK